MGGGLVTSMLMRLACSVAFVLRGGEGRLTLVQLASSVAFVLRAGVGRRGGGLGG